MSCPAATDLASIITTWVDGSNTCNGSPWDYQPMTVVLGCLQERHEDPAAVKPDDSAAGAFSHRRMSLEKQGSTESLGSFLGLVKKGRESSSGLWECGNRGAISKGVGKRGKPVFGFPRFPSPVISAALLPSRGAAGSRMRNSQTPCSWLVASAAPPQCRFRPEQYGRGP